MPTRLLKQLHWGSGAGTHKNVEAFEDKDVPSTYAVLLFHVQGMDYRKGLTKTTRKYWHANANSGRKKNNAQRKNHFQLNEGPKNKQ